MESSETLDEDKLSQVAKALGVGVEAIKNFSEENVINYFNSFYDSSFSHSQGTFSANQCTFSPLDKIVELYERMLQMEREKIEYLEKLNKK
jgi:hypothetical protein